METMRENSFYISNSSFFGKPRAAPLQFVRTGNTVSIVMWDINTDQGSEDFFQKSYSSKLSLFRFIT